MSRTDHVKSSPLLLLVAGAKGAVGSTLAIALAVMQKSPESVLPCLTTGKRFAYLGSIQDNYMAGWDTSDKTLLESIASHRVVPEKVYRSCISEFEGISTVLGVKFTTGTPEKMAATSIRWTDCRPPTLGFGWATVLFFFAIDPNSLC